MDGHGKSDRPIVPKNPANKGPDASAPTERGEGRGRAKGNPDQQTSNRTQCRAELQQALIRVRQAADKDKKAKFTALWHHVYDPERLRAEYRDLKRQAASGVDGETWQHYGESLEENLRDLSERLRRGAYRARPVRRVYIPKPDGRQRPIGIPALEDKIVQGAAANRQRRGEGKPETFDFLGFTHICDKTRSGRFIVLRQGRRKKIQAKLKELKLELRRRFQDPVHEVGQWLHAVLWGHYQYYGVPRNIESLQSFYHRVIRLWRRILSRRSQRGHVTWEQMNKLVKRWLPRPRITHPYPEQRLRVTT